MPQATQAARNQAPGDVGKAWPGLEKPSCFFLQAQAHTQPPYCGELLASPQLVSLPAVGPQHLVEPVPGACFSAQAPVLFLVALVAPFNCKLLI